MSDEPTFCTATTEIEICDEVYMLDCTQRFGHVEDHSAKVWWPAEAAAATVTAARAVEGTSFCPRDHGCSLPAGHDGDCELTAALCFCAECETKTNAPTSGRAPVAAEPGRDTNPR